MNTKGYEGNIHKTAAVYTNDPKMAQFTLGVRAFVHVPISVSPSYMILRGDAEREISREMKIVAGLEKPLVIQPEKFNLAGKVNYEISEIEKGRSYVVRFSTIPGNPGSFGGTLRLKTNYEEKPILDLQIRTHITGKEHRGK